MSDPRKTNRDDDFEKIDRGHYNPQNDERSTDLTEVSWYEPMPKEQDHSDKED